MDRLGGILKEWDGANQSQRAQLLQEFLTLTSGKTAIDINDGLGHSTSLLFARFVASLRLRYNMLGVEPLISAIHRFTGATGGLEYVEELLESGSLLTLIEMLTLEKPSEEDKNAAIVVIYSVSSYGLKFKEIICKVGAIRVICECLAKAQASELQQNCFHLMDSLVKGNPRYVASIYRALIALLPADSSFAVHTALQLLRFVQSQVEPIKELISPLLGTAGSYHGEVRYETRLYMINLATIEPVNAHLLNGMVRLLELTHEKHTLMDYIKQATIGETLDALINQNTCDWVERELIPRQIISKLVRALANTKHPESQRIAARALMSISHKLPDKTSQIERALGPLASHWHADAENVHDKIDEIVADALMNNDLTI